MRLTWARATVTLVAATAAIAPAVAIAGTPSVTKGKTLNFGVNAVGPPINARIPSSLAFSAPGFTFDPRAVSKHCNHEQAVLNECPTASKIGVGTMTIHVVAPKFTRNTTIPIDMYLASKTAVLAVAFVGGPHVVPATISTRGGVALSFNPLPKAPQFPSTTLTLIGVQIQLGTTRIAVTHVHKRVHGKRKTVIKRTRYYLVHEPAGCHGSRTTTISMGFADGTSATVDAKVAC